MCHPFALPLEARFLYPDQAVMASVQNRAGQTSDSLRQPVNPQTWQFTTALDNSVLVYCEYHVICAIVFCCWRIVKSRWISHYLEQTHPTRTDTRTYGILLWLIVFSTNSHEPSLVRMCDVTMSGERPRSNDAMLPYAGFIYLTS